PATQPPLRGSHGTGCRPRATSTPPPLIASTSPAFSRSVRWPTRSPPRRSGQLASAELFSVRFTVNGVVHDVQVPSRRLLSDCLRHDLRLTGTHVGCEHGVCGACTVLVDGVAVRS